MATFLVILNTLMIMSFEVLTAVKTSKLVVWETKPCGSVSKHQCSGGE
jgi:hypothetical protein